MKLEDKILSKEDLIKVLSYDHRVAHTYDQYEASLSRAYRNTAHAWWSIREYLRTLVGIYQTTEALDKVNAHVCYHAHVSTTDKTKVAFTPDKAFGERDAQLVMSVGKFIQRVLPYATDEYVQALVADHLAELSDEVEWITGPEIANVYATTTLTSCMAGKVWSWVNPALAYDAPGIKLAVLRDAKGVINARCLVYEDGDVKRRIRNYGDAKLDKRLDRLGYKLGDWQGVKFRTIKQKAGYDRTKFEVAIPYLDCNGGPVTQRGATLMLLDGQLLCIEDSQRSALLAAGANLAQGGNTSGFVTLQNTEAAQFVKPNLITGGTLNVLTDSPVKVYIDGVEGFATADDLDYSEFVIGVFVKDGKLQKGFWMRRSACFDHYGTLTYDDTEGRCYYGYYKLSAKYYPEETGWVRHTASVVTEDGEAHYIKSEDYVRVCLMANGSVQRSGIHKSKLDKTYTRLADYDGAKWYAAPGVEILRTPSKAKVVHGLHDIVLTWKGWDYTRNANSSVRLYSSVVRYHSKDAANPELAAHVTKLTEADLEMLAADSTRSLGRVLQGFWSRGTYFMYPMSSNQHFKRRVDVSYSDLSPTLEFFEEVLADLKSQVLSYSTRLADLPLKLAVKFCERKIAEMRAVNGEEPVKAPEVVPEVVVMSQPEFA